MPDTELEQVEITHDSNGVETLTIPGDYVALEDIEDASSFASNPADSGILGEGRLCRQVREFHRLMGAPVATSPGMISVERIRLRLSLIIEEATELAEALGSDWTVTHYLRQANGVLALDEFSNCADLVSAADALGDIQYVVAGTAVEMGLPLEAVTDEIHRSNLTKVGGKVRADGKILKSENYQPPQLEPILFGGAA